METMTRHPDATLKEARRQAEALRRDLGTGNPERRDDAGQRLRRAGLLRGEAGPDAMRGFGGIAPFRDVIALEWGFGGSWDALTTALEAGRPPGCGKGLRRLLGRFQGPREGSRSAPITLRQARRLLREAGDQDLREWTGYGEWTDRKALWRELRALGAAFGWDASLSDVTRDP